MELNDIKSILINSVQFSRSSAIIANFKETPTVGMHSPSENAGGSEVGLGGSALSSPYLFSTKPFINNGVKWFAVIDRTDSSYPIKWVKESKIASFKATGG